MAAGQSWEKWGRKLYSLKAGDLVAAYLKDFGFVGIGRVVLTARPALDFRHRGKPLSAKQLVQPRLLGVEKELKEEHLVGIEWINAVPRDEAKWRKGAKLYTTPLKFLEKQFESSWIVRPRLTADFEASTIGGTRGYGGLSRRMNMSGSHAPDTGSKNLSTVGRDGEHQGSVS